jgi:4-alpha-glucanotransferase
MTTTLEELAHINGVQTTYHRIDGSICVANPEVLRAVVEALGQHHQPPLPPVLVAWEDRPTPVMIHHGHLPAVRTARCSLRVEDGATAHWEILLAATVTPFTLPSHLAWGYHRLTVEFGNTVASSLVISAPVTAFSDSLRRWGVFLPLYSLRTKSNWGAGDFSDLRTLIAWTSAQGGSIVGTLPLIPTQWEKEATPSPYSSWSRLFWNPFYIDCTAIPEFARCREAREMAVSPDARQTISTCCAAPIVQYHDIMAIKRRVLQVLSRDFLAAPSSRRAAFEDYTRTHPDLIDYARFQATSDRLQSPWPAWPDILPPCEAIQVHYHQYVQWIADEQLAHCALDAHQKNLRLYLDFPIGSHPDGFDAWKYRGVFVPQMKVGAPPDSFFRDGQDWGFQPLHPQALRKGGYDYFIKCLRHHLKYAGILRLDHVMNLHRLFWIPAGFSAQDGVYVRYPAEEFYAILCLESMRHRVIIVGEDLGLVPPEARSMMQTHGLRRTHITQFDTSSDQVSHIPSACMAALNTHDLPPFAAFWKDRPDPAGSLARHLRALAASPAEMCMVNLEDLWLETEPQNRPGTLIHNWQHKAQKSLEDMATDATVQILLHDVDRLRHGAKQ